MKLFKQGEKIKHETPDRGFSKNENDFFVKRVQILKLIENTISVIVDDPSLINNFNIEGKELLADAIMFFIENEKHENTKKVIESMTNKNTSFQSINEISNNLYLPKLDYKEYHKFMEIMEKYTNYNEFEIYLTNKYSNLNILEAKYKLECLEYIIMRNPKNEASNLIRKVLTKKIEDYENNNG